MCGGSALTWSSRPPPTTSRRRPTCGRSRRCAGSAATPRSAPGCSRSPGGSARPSSAPGPATGSWPPEPGAQTTVDLLLAALDPDRRAAFVLTQLLGCSYAEAAQVCDCPIGTIRSRVARAREDLDALLREPAERPRSAGGSGSG